MVTIALAYIHGPWPAGEDPGMEEEQSIALKILGCWDLVLDGTSLSVGSRQQRLIAALAIHGRRSRSALGGLLWPNCTEAHAMGSLRAAVFKVSRRLPSLLTTCDSDLALAESVDVDLHHVRSALLDAASAQPPVDQWSVTPADVDLLPGWYDDWVVTEQEHLRNQYLNATERLAELALGRHDHYPAVHLAQTVLELDPLRESAVRILVETHLAVGNRATAMQAFRHYTDRLADELGIRPSQAFLAFMAPHCRR
jgi:SARP family transcriptional regulator, regulator of embCAB operon